MGRIDVGISTTLANSKKGRKMDADGSLFLYLNMTFNSKYPSVQCLRQKAKKRIPKFAFEYLDGGCNEEVNLHKNTSDIRKVELLPYYLNKHTGSSIKAELFGHEYDAPFGISPIGLQGLMWPNSPEILAKAAHKHNVPFVLSTVSTSSIERIAEITEGRAWFQLYHQQKIVYEMRF